MPNVLLFHKNDIGVLLHALVVMLSHHCIHRTKSLNHSIMRGHINSMNGAPI